MTSLAVAIIKTDEEIRQYHRKHLYELSLKTVGAVPWLDDPNDGQKECIHRKLTRSDTWPKAYKYKDRDDMI